MPFLDTLLLSVIVCGIVFASLGLKWCLSWHQILWRAGLFGVTNGLIAAWAGLSSANFWWQTILANAVLLVIEIPASILPFFYRDPERRPPRDGEVIVSAADGLVVYVKRIEGGKVPLCEKRGQNMVIDELAQSGFAQRSGFLIGVAMNFLDVHVNRAPMDGTVAMLQHIAGQFASLRIPEAVLRNERKTLIIENSRASVALVQIASRLVRRIVSYVKAGESVARGQRIGMIKFGSQVDMILSDSDFSEILVKAGDRVFAGETPIARFRTKPQRGQP
jgi:phosphatidylserine decarboxylase